MKGLFNLARLRNFVAALFGSALLVGAVPAVAAACASGAESSAFAQFGDNAEYTPIPSGSFEATAPGWSLSKATVVVGHDGYNLTAATHSLAIEPGGSAISPPVCAQSTYPSFRFVVRQLSGTQSATLNVRVQWLNLLGLTISASAGTTPNNNSWMPSPVMKLSQSLPLLGGLLGGLGLQVRLAFQASGGSFAIDNVYIDPRMR
ncbi:MAG: hypothetical protein ACRDK2_15520 [Solirubrobacteraceae bacterium]